VGFRHRQQQVLPPFPLMCDLRFKLFLTPPQRVLAFDSAVGLGLDPPATLVLGQISATVGISPTIVTNSSIQSPAGVLATSVGLFVADAGSNRVVCYRFLLFFFRCSGSK